MIPTARPKRACVCKVAVLQGNLAALYFEKAPNEDAYHQPLKMAMEEGALAKEGFILLTNRRVSSSSNDTMMNAGSSYPRKIYVINLDENTVNARRLAMEAACQVMNSPQNNRYNIPYIIDDTSDVTEANLPKVDEWVLDKHVVDIIFTLYNNVTSDWARTNRDESKYFFTGPPYCQAAIFNLGYRDNDD